MRTTLLDANFRQTDDGLATTERLLVSLREAWFTVSAGAQPDTSTPNTLTPETPAASEPSFPWSVIGDAMQAARCWNA
jgi:hypothetical protein